jgi:lipoate-protein ligase A
LIGGISSLGLRLDLERGTTGKTDSKCKPCFVSASRYEVTCGGRKVVGSAQKAGRNAVLQHGSIPLGCGYLRVVDYVNCGEADREKLLSDMKAATSGLHELLKTKPQAEVVASALTEGFADKFRLNRSPIWLSTLTNDLDVTPKGLGNEELRPACRRTKPLDTSSQPFI